MARTAAGRTGRMLQTLSETRAPVSELVQFRVEDVSLPEQVVTIQDGEGGEGRPAAGWRARCALESRT